jgi:hypothetical protein
MDSPIVASSGHVDAPWIAAYLAVLNEAAVDVTLDVNFQALATKRTRDRELVWHFQRSYCNAGPVSEALHVSFRSRRSGKCHGVGAGLKDPAGNLWFVAGPKSDPR